MKYFPYGNKEIEHLKQADKILGAAIEKIGMLKRPVLNDVFQATVVSIIGQQISTKASKTVKTRMLDLLGSLTPEAIGRVSIDEIQQCGMTFRKASYIKGVGKAAHSKKIEFDKLHQEPDEKVIKKLLSLHGIGEWTAEMILISGLHRPDIVSYKDLAIRRGMKRLYGLTTLSKEEFDNYKKRYSPYGTVASIYLWELSHQ